MLADAEVNDGGVKSKVVHSLTSLLCLIIDFCADGLHASHDVHTDLNCVFAREALVNFGELFVIRLAIFKLLVKSGFL